MDEGISFSVIDFLQILIERFFNDARTDAAVSQIENRNLTFGNIIISPCLGDE